MASDICVTQVGSVNEDHLKGHMIAVSVEGNCNTETRVYVVQMWSTVSGVVHECL